MKIDSVHYSVKTAFVYFCSLGLILSAAGCSKMGSSSSSSSTTNAMTGTISAGPLNGATVTVYALNTDGSQGQQLGTATTNSSGQYSVAVAAQTSPILVVASGGSYTEEASGTTVTMSSAQIRTVLPSLAANQTVGVTPVTEIATQRALASVATNSSVGLAALITNANQLVAAAVGLTDITLPPAIPTLAATSATDTHAAQYAVVLASISQIAKTATTSAGSQVNSLDVMQALATSFTYNGSFASTVGSGATAIPVPTASGSTVSLAAVFTAVNGGNATFSGAMTTATSTYVNSTAASNLGYNDPDVVPPTTYTTTPPPTVAIVAPPVPTSLPNLSPTVSGPPPPPSQAAKAAPTLAYSSSTIVGVSGSLLGVAPTQLLGNGGAVTACTISPALPSPLTINAANCVISGTPSGTLTTTQYTVTATNSAGSTTASLALSVITTPTLVFGASDADNGVVGSAMTVTPGTLSANGAVVSSCTITPALPSPLSLNPNTCVISGTPTALLSSATYTVTATNAAGQTHASVTLSVSAGVPTLSYTSSIANTGMISYPMSVSPTQLLANGATITNCTSSPSLPSPLVIDPTTCIISGTPTATLSSTSYTITATNSAGTSTGTVSLNVLAKPFHIYVTDTENGVYSCSINTTSGQIGSCLAPQYTGSPNYRGLSSLTYAGVTKLYAAALSTVQTCSADATGVLACESGGGVIDSNVDTRNVTATNIGSNYFVYAVEAGTNASGKINVCPLSAAGADITTCSVTNGGQTPPTPGMGTASGSWFPASIDFNTVGSNTTAYVVGWNTAQGTNSLFDCSVDGNTGVLSGCAASATVTGALLAGLTSESTSYLNLNQIVVKTIGSNTYAYLLSTYNIYKCTITGVGDSLSGCVVSQGGVTAFPTTTPAAWYPTSFAFSNLGGATTYAYVADTLNNKLYVCTVSNSDGSLSGCTANTMSPALALPYGVSVF